MDLALPCYQVVELTLTHFPTDMRVMVKIVHRNPASPSNAISAATERTYVQLAGS